MLSAEADNCPFDGFLLQLITPPPQKKYVDKTQFLPPLSTKFYQIKMKKINSSFYLYSFFIVIAWEKTLSTVDFPPYLKMVQVYG